MPAIKLEQFGGMFPAWDPHLLPTGQGAFARDTYLFGGNLIGWRRPKVLRSLTNSSARAVYRIPKVQQSQARAYLVFLGTPQDGDNVSVGDITYTFTFPLTDRNQVLLGLDAIHSAQYFTSALTADDGANTNAGKFYGNHTVANGDVYFTLPDTTAPVGMADPSFGTVVIGGTSYPYVLLGATAFGSSYNNVLLATSAPSRLLWLYDLASLSDTTTALQGGSNPTFDSTITSPSIWLEFNDPDTNVVKSPIVNDTWNRYYWASPSDMPKYNTYDRILSGSNPWLLGVPSPGCAPTLAVVGGGNSQALGNVTQSGGSIPFNGNRVILIPMITTGDSQVIDIQWRLDPVRGKTDQNTTPTTNWAAVVYDDDGSSGVTGVPGKPLNLLNTTPIVKGVTTDVPNIASFANPTPVLGNAVYWVGIIIDTQNFFEGGPAGGSLSTTWFDASFNNGPPGTAPTGTDLHTGDLGVNIWADLVTNDVIESRSYAYTWVTEYDEEGPPSPPTILDGWSNGTWTIGLWLPPPDDMGLLRSIKKVKLYRTVPGTAGGAAFFFVDTITLDDLQNDGTDDSNPPTNPKVVAGTYTDNVADSVIALNDEIPSSTWFPPPGNLQGFTVMQNGMIAAFVGNELWFCEPYRPHAWPPGNVLTTDHTIVGLGMAGGNLVICTASNPYIATGSTPAGMVMQKAALPNPCLSRASILSGDKACMYMSPNGLIQVDPNGVAVNTTDLWVKRENWQQLVPQKYTRAMALAACYYCFGTTSPPSVPVADASVAQQGFIIPLDNDAASFTIWPQPGGHRVGFAQLTSPTGFNVDNVITDVWSGTGMMISNGSVYYFDFSDAAPALMPYTWRSKIYQQNVKRQYSAMKVFFQVPPGVTAPVTRNTAVASDPSWLTLRPDQYGILRTYVDVDGTGNLTLIDCREITKSGELLRVVDGFKAEQWQWEITARVNLANVQIATAPKELGSV